MGELSLKFLRGQICHRIFQSCRNQWFLRTWSPQSPNSDTMAIAELISPYTVKMSSNCADSKTCSLW